MDRNDLEQRIINEVNIKRGRIIAKSSVRALLGIFPNPIKSLGEIFFSSEESIDSEKHSVEQGIIIDLLCKIDNNIQEMIESTKNKLGNRAIAITGEIISTGNNTESVTGIEISSGSGPVEFKPGTKITAHGNNVHSVTGLKIGD